MKYAFLILTSAVCLAFTSCTMTPQQAAAAGIYAAASDFAVMQLDKNPAALKGLQDLQAALVNIINGKVGPYDMGVLNAELQPIVNAAAADPERADGFRRLGNLISSASQVNGANPTTTQGILIAKATDAQNGLRDGILYWQGANSTAPISATVKAQHARKKHPKVVKVDV